MSKTVFIHRKVSFAQSSHTEPEVADYFNQAFKAIGPYWRVIGKVIGTGLTTQEQRILMPILHGVEPTDKDFRKATELYFDNILTKVPPKGLKLEIGLEDDNMGLSDTNLPINVQDFVIYRHAIGHPNMSMTQDEAESNPIKMFYLVDPDRVSDTGAKLNKLEDDALQAYFKYKDDEVKVDQILTMLGINIKALSFSDKVNRFKKASLKEEGKSEFEQEHTLQRFISICEDPDLLMKYLIQEMIAAQILQREGTLIFIKESGQQIGVTLKEAVAFLKNPKNSREYSILRAQYENIVRKGVSLPKSFGNEETEEAITVEPVRTKKTKE